MPINQRVNINVDLDKLKNLACPVCGNIFFYTNCSVFKILPSIQSPSGRPQTIQVNLLECACGMVYQVKDTELIPFNQEEKQE